jgi:hypothetical protein
LRQSVLRPAATLRANKPLLAARLVPGRRLSQAAVSHRAQPSALRATCYIAKPTRVSAKPLTQQQKTDAKRRPGPGPVRRFFVLKAQSEKWEPVFGTNCARNQTARALAMIQKSWTMLQRTK